MTTMYARSIGLSGATETSAFDLQTLGSGRSHGAPVVLVTGSRPWCRSAPGASCGRYRVPNIEAGRRGAGQRVWTVSGSRPLWPARSGRNAEA